MRRILDRPALRRAVLGLLAVIGAISLGGVPLPAADRPGSAGIGPSLFEMALGAARCAVQAGAVRNPQTLTVIDYSRPSTSKRLWVFDLASEAVLFEELVAHGQGSGENFATAFSNTPESRQSSLGLFATAEPYTGRNGYSLRLDGLERGINDRARERAIVLHGAPYVSADFLEAQGRLGRSWGCPVVRAGIVRALIDRVKGGGLVFVYYPDRTWLQSSIFLGGCAAASDGRTI
jgi:hypothetical protein